DVVHGAASAAPLQLGLTDGAVLIHDHPGYDAVPARGTVITCGGAVQLKELLQRRTALGQREAGTFHGGEVGHGGRRAAAERGKQRQRNECRKYWQGAPLGAYDDRRTHSGGTHLRG